MNPPDLEGFKDIMGFNPTNEVLYEDNPSDNTIPDIQKITKKNNILPIWGNVQTMNLNTLVLENILQSTYYKNYLNEVTTFQQVVDEIYYNVRHLEPWERGTRKTQGMTGMCGGVRGVGAGGVISTAFCLLYKMFVLRITRKQLVTALNSRQSIYLRGLSLMYVRFTQPPADLWSWFEPYLDDETEIDPRSGGGDKMPIGQLAKMMITKLDFYGTLFPRIPIPIQKDIDNKIHERTRLLHGDEDRSDDERDRRRSRSRDRDRDRRRSRSRSRDRQRRRSRDRDRRLRSHSRSRDPRKHRSRDRNRDHHRASKNESKSSSSFSVIPTTLDESANGGATPSQGWHRGDDYRSKSATRSISPAEATLLFSVNVDCSASIVETSNRNKRPVLGTTPGDSMHEKTVLAAISVTHSHTEALGPLANRRRYRCRHHLRHHHCRLHRHTCPPSHSPPSGDKNKQPQWKNYSTDGTPNETGKQYERQNDEEHESPKGEVIATTTNPVSPQNSTTFCVCDTDVVPPIGPGQERKRESPDFVG